MKKPILSNEEGQYGPVTIILWVIAIAFVIWLLSVLL